MDSGPGAYAPSRNDDPLDTIGFTEAMVQCGGLTGTAVMSARAIVHLVFTTQTGLPPHVRALRNAFTPIATDVKQFIDATADRKMRPTTLSSVSPSERSQNTLCRPSDRVITP
jgi:hypothetical protein